MGYSAIAALYLIRVRKKYPELDDEIKEILAEHTSCETSISLRQFVDKYKSRTGKTFPLHMCAIRATEFLVSVPFTVAYRKSGMPHFFRLPNKDV
ncbi:uncharacterized protein LOC128860076 [Anastrepha ludens]|uniref:uncharacterized protein LOC128860076 n=1 Tax=Anastrepha ludens TaxID=28586 RepID=UPI0023AF7525|nr:uncharacterized protein LOC128860076 [Anastrepha ludens]